MTLEPLIRDLAAAWHRAPEPEKEPLVGEALVVRAFQREFPGLTVHERKLLVNGEHVVMPPQGNRHFLVESRSRPGQHHSVSWEFDDTIGKETWVCTCESGNFRGECRHIRAVDLWSVGRGDVSLETTVSDE